MDEPLTYEDIGHLMEAKAEKLVQASDEDAEQVIREMMETLSRARNVRPREKRVDANGRVSVGRDLSGVYGLTLFHPDPNEQDDVDTGDDGL